MRQTSHRPQVDAERLTGCSQAPSRARAQRRFGCSPLCAVAVPRPARHHAAAAQVPFAASAEFRLRCAPHRGVPGFQIPRPRKRRCCPIPRMDAPSRAVAAFQAIRTAVARTRAYGSIRPTTGPGRRTIRPNGVAMAAAAGCSTASRPAAPVGLVPGASVCRWDFQACSAAGDCPFDEDRHQRRPCCFLGLETRCG
jgi:hypothetical protein